MAAKAKREPYKRRGPGRPPLPPSVERVRTFSVRLPDSLFRKLRDRVNVTDLKLQDATAEAFALWCAENTQEQRRALTTFPDLTPEETRILRALLAGLRAGGDMGALVRALAQHSGKGRTAAAGG